MAVTTKFLDVPAEINKIYEHGSKSNPFLGIIGARNGLAAARAWEFTSSQDFQVTGGDVSITENASVSGAAPTTVARNKETNVAQILQYGVEVSYARESDVAGLANVGGEGSMSPLDFQVDAKMKQSNKDWNWAAINGTKVVAADSNTAFKMGGLYNVVETEGTNFFANGAVPRALTKDLIEDSAVAAMDAGAGFEDPAFLITASMKQKINALYGNAIESITEGGVNLTVVHSVVGTIRFIVDNACSATKLAIVDLAFAQPVVLPVKGQVLMIEPLGKSGASESYQVYLQPSVDYTSGLAHVVIADINLAL